MTDRVAVGVDVGFDGGAAAWVLHLSGCVATASSEMEAIKMVPRRIEAFSAWLSGSGERVPRSSAHDVEVVERAESYVLDDGYEVNATFRADREPVSPDEAETALRWLDRAHRRLRAAISSAGERPLSGEGRTRDELLDHVVRAERWLATRVEPDQAGIVFPAEDPTIEERLRANPPFVRHHLLAATGGDGIHERVDSKGERWTTRKVLRRLVYHVLDHAEELERRQRLDVPSPVEGD